MSEANSDIHQARSAHDREWAGTAGRWSLAEALDHIGKDIAGCDSRTLYARLVERLAATSPIGAAGVWLIEPDDRTLARQAWGGPIPIQAPEHGRLDLERSMLGHVVRTGKPAQIESARIAREVFPVHVLDLRQLPAFAGFPLVRAGTRLGLLGLFCRRWLNDGDMALLQVFTRLVAAEMSAADDPAAGGSEPAREEGARSEQDEEIANFIALIAHELRTPLTGLRGNIQLALMSVRKGDFSRIENRLDTSLRLIDSVTALVQNLQDISRLQRGIIALSLTEADLTMTVQGAVRRIERLVSDNHHTVEVVAPGPTVVAHDVRHLEQVFFNLLSNAVAYSPEGGPIRVVIERTPEAATVSISDAGIGIPPGEMDRIFEPYFRGDLARTFHAKGLGLGLAISRAIVEMHGGTIEVGSTLHQGTTITIRLPVDAAA